jgi:hypothetical protein
VTAQLWCHGRSGARVFGRLSEETPAQAGVMGQHRVGRCCRRGRAVSRSTHNTGLWINPIHRFMLRPASPDVRKHDSGRQSAEKTCWVSSSYPWKENKATTGIRSRAGEEGKIGRGWRWQCSPAFSGMPAGPGYLSRISAPERAETAPKPSWEGLQLGGVQTVRHQKLCPYTMFDMALTCRV